MSARALALSALAVSLCLVPARAVSPPADPPAGFVALFNGRDLAGWYGLPHIDPAKLAAMSADERAQKRAADAVEFTQALERRERRAGQRRQRAVCHHRPRLRRHRAAPRVQDRRQGRQRHLPARHAAGADLGHDRGRRQVEAWRRQGLRRPVEQHAGRGRQGPAGARRQALRRVEQLPHPPGRRADLGLAQRQAGRGRRPDGELLGSHGAAAESGPDPAADARRRDPLAQRLPARDPRGGGEQV